MRFDARLVCLAMLCVVVVAPSQTQRPVQSGAAPSATSPDPNAPRTIDSFDSVFIEELTWMEIRDALKAGKNTVIVATGGIEQNGPYLATGKHNYILRATTEAIARKLGDALVAPIVPFVPEGNIEPPSGHMRYPGTISLREETFRALLTDIASSIRAHGFQHIIFIADSGGNQEGMKDVAARLSAAWNGKPAVHYIAEYYDYPGLTRWLQVQGVRQVDEGYHDDYGITSQMMTVDPNTVRMKQRMAKGKFSINGVNLAPAEKTVAMGKRAVEYRASITVDAIRKARGR